MLKRLREDVAVVFERDPAARGWWEVVTLYPGVHAVWLHRISHALWRRGWHWPARALAHLGRWLTGIEIHPGARLGRRLFIDHGMGVVIGETAEVGDDCTLYHGVTLGGTSWEKGKRHPTLEDNVVVGAGAKILGPVTVGAGARVGSNAVVVKDVPAGATVVGVPGRLVAKGGARAVDARRQAMARRMGFDAYGLTRDMPDPVAQAINCMLDHLHQVDERMEVMCKTLRALGAEMEEAELPDLKACEVFVSEEGAAPAKGEGEKNPPKSDK